LQTEEGGDAQIEFELCSGNEVSMRLDIAQAVHNMGGEVQVGPSPWGHVPTNHFGVGMLLN
jgi:hypothetical protein